MNENRSDHRSSLDLIIRITREFDAPRELVWKAFTDAGHIEQWWGPKGFTTRVQALDLRPGGRTHYVMAGPDGKEYPAGGMFREVVPHERIVSTDEFEEGFEALSVMDLPEGMIVTYHFEDLGGKTRLTVEIAHPTEEERRKHEKLGVVEGWNSSFDCLDEYLATLSD